MHSCRANTQPWPSRGRMWSLTPNWSVQPFEALPEQLNLLIIVSPCNWTTSFLSKRMKPPTTLIKLFTKQPVSENNSFHLPPLCEPVLNLVWDVWIWERAFICALKNIYNLEKNPLVLASVICLPGNFQFKLKQFTEQRDGTGKYILYCWLALFSSFLLSAHLLISSHTEGKV